MAEIPPGNAQELPFASYGTHQCHWPDKKKMFPDLDVAADGRQNSLVARKNRPVLGESRMPV